MNKKILTYITITFVCLVFTRSSQAEVDSQKLTKISELLFSYEKLGRFSGAISIKKENDVIYEYSRGFANKTTEIKNGSDKIFAIASLSKQFTATAILLLAQQGKLSLDDSIAKHLPYYENDIGQKITIYHLLTHTDGIPDPMDMGSGVDGKNDPILKEKTIAIERIRLINTFKNLPNLFAPGSRYEYANTGYILLADIIERTSGESYGSFLNKNIFDPAGMTNTSAERPNKSSLLVESYNGIGTDKVHSTKLHNSWLVGAAGLYSTLNDLFKWVVAMNNHKILKDNGFDYLLSNPVDLGTNNEFYGYGMEMKTLWEQKVYRHDGATLGTIADFIYFPEKDLTIVIYMNHVHNVNAIGHSIQMRKLIVKQVSGILLGHEIPGKLALSNNINSSLEEYIGHYVFNDEHHVEIILNDNSLQLKTMGDKPWSLYSLAQNTALPISPLTEKSTRLFNILNTKKYADLAELFDRKMASLPSSVFEGFWKQLESKLGALEDNYSFSKNNENSEVQQRLIFESGIVDMAIFFDKEGKIKGIQNSPPIPRDDNRRLSVKLLQQKDDQLMIDGYVIKEESDLFLKFTRDSKNQITGFNYKQMGQHVAIKQ